MKLNVGLSKKVTDHQFGSKGGNIGLEVEIDASLLRDSSKLQGQIHQLFWQVRKALDNELQSDKGGSVEVKELSDHTSFAVSDVRNPTAKGSSRMASEKQLSLIQGLIRRGKLPFQLLLDAHKIDSFDQLTVQQASSLITELKAKVE